MVTIGFVIMASAMMLMPSVAVQARPIDDPPPPTYDHMFYAPYTAAYSNYSCLGLQIYGYGSVFDNSVSASTGIVSIRDVRHSGGGIWPYTVYHKSDMVQQIIPPVSGNYLITGRWDFNYGIGLSSTTSGSWAFVNVYMKGNVLDRTSGGVWSFGTWQQATAISYSCSGFASQTHIGQSIGFLQYHVYLVAGHTYNIYNELVVSSGSWEPTYVNSASTDVDLSSHSPTLNPGSEHAQLYDLEVFLP